MVDKEAYVYSFAGDDSGFQRTIKNMQNSVDGFVNSSKSMWRGFSFGDQHLQDKADLINDYQNAIKELDSEYRKIYEDFAKIRDMNPKDRTAEQRQQYREEQAELDALIRKRKQLVEALSQTKEAYRLLEERIRSYRDALYEAEKEEDEHREKQKKAPKVTGDLNKEFEKLIKTVKRYGLALLGVRSAYMFFRRAMNRALSNNAELSNKFSAMWTAFGNALMPLLERVATVILTALSYLNIFLKALSGGKIDLLANTSKSAKSTASSMKEANKYLAGFDELNNVDTNTGSGGDSGAGLGFADAFKDIKIDTTWADRIQAFGEWCKNNIPLVIGIIGALAVGIYKLKKEFTSLELLGIVLLFVGLYEIIKGISDFIHGVVVGDFRLVAKGLGEIVIGIGLVIAAIALLTGTFTLGIGLLVAGIVALGALIIKHKDEIGEKLRAFVERAKVKWAEFKEWVASKGQDLVRFFKEKLSQIGDWWGNLKEKVINGATTMVSKLKEKFADLKENWKTILGNGIISAWEGVVNTFITGANYIIRALNKISFTIPDWVPVIGGKSISLNLQEYPLKSLARLETGTNYVPNDQLALLHKGEAVIPKKFNSSEYFSNGETNELLQILIDKVDGLEINPYITVKDVGEASVKYQNQQYRLRGRALVNG